MVRVVVDHRRASPNAAPLEPTMDAAKAMQGLGNARHVEAQRLPDGHRRQRVLHVVRPEHRQHDLAERATLSIRHGEATTVGPRVESGRDQVGLRRQAVGHHPVIARQQRQHTLNVGVVQTQNDATEERHPTREVDERLADRFEIRVGVEMIEVDVGDHRDDRHQAQKAAVELISLRDQELARADPRASARDAHTTTNDNRGVETRFRQERSDQRRRRGLAVGTRDRDAVLETHQLGEHLRPTHHGNAPRACRFDLGIVVTDGRRLDHQIDAIEMVRVMADGDRDAEPFETRHGLAARLIAPADRQAFIAQKHLGDAAHAGATDAHEVNV